jgi:hypothetical protein
MLGGKNGGRKVYVWGEKWPAACWVGERKERKGKKNKRKSWPAARGWLGEKENREREKKKKKKKKGLLLRTWLGGRKKRERKKKKKSPAVYVAGCMARKKIYISPTGEMGCVAEGKKIYCRPDGCMAGQGKKNNKKKKQEDSETCGWNSKFENMAGENVMEFYFF